MKSYTLSLSRWHKVAERLARSYAELTQLAKNTFNNTQISEYLGDAQVSRVRDLSAQQVASLHRAVQLKDALGKRHHAIG